jgi:hypothetical protein
MGTRRPCLTASAIFRWGVAWLAQTVAARQRRSQVPEVLDSDVLQDADVVRRRVDPGHTRCLDRLVLPLVHKARDQAAMLAELVGEVGAIVEFRRPQILLVRRQVGSQVVQDSGL